MRRSARLAAFCLCVFAAVGCVRPTRSGVNVKSLTTDLVFGVPPQEEPVTPANTSLSPEAPLPLISVVPAGPRLTPRPVVPATPRPDCRKAGPNDFPDQAAPSVPTAVARAGRYRWNVSGRQTASGGTFALPSITYRTVLDVTGSVGDFTYTVEEHDLVLGSTTLVRSTFRVLNEASGQDDPGIYLTKVVRSGGARTVEFNPQPPVLFLPIPATIGEPADVADVNAQPQIDSTGVDPVSLQTMTNRGHVARRQRVDACGTVIDSWFVQASQQFVQRRQDGTPESTTRRYNYGIAPHYGGLIVIEHIENPCAQQTAAGDCTPDPTFVMDAGIGQVKPDEMAP